MTDDQQPDRPTPDDAGAPDDQRAARPESGAAPGDRPPAERHGAARPSTHGDPGMPAAGRRPDAAPRPEPDAPVDPHAPLSADGPTVRLGAAMVPRTTGDNDPETDPDGPSGHPATGAEPGSSRYPANSAGEPAEQVVAGDDEPTRAVESPSPLDGGSTARLQPPFFAPETTRTSPAPDAAQATAARRDDPSWPEAADDSAVGHEVGPWPEAAADPAVGHDGPWPEAAADPAVGHEGPWPQAADDSAVGHEVGPWPETAADPVAERRDRWRSADGAAAGRDDWWSDGGRDPAARGDDPSWDEGAASVDDSAGQVTDPRGGTDVGERASRTGGGTPGGSPEAVTPPDGDHAAAVPDEAEPRKAGPEKPARRLSSAGALIWVLLALLGFTLVVQLRSNDQDAGLATARQEDLVGILSDLEARDQRLQQEINALEESQRQLTSGVAGRQAALAEAGKRADELGLLSGTLPARGPGLKITIDPRGQPIKASAILNAVQELRGAGGEVMEIMGDNGVAVRVVASSYFVDADGGRVIVDGKQLSGPYTLWVIGVPATMQTALQIPGGVVASVSQAGGNVTMEQRTTVEVTAVRQPTSLQYARPVS